ncbi:unnamed protein product [Absidia cylindrospora]
MLPTIKPSNKNCSSPASSTSLGSGSSVPLSSVITSPIKTRAPHMPSPSRCRQRSKSVGRPSDQRSLARQQTFNKLCGEDTPPPPPIPPIPSMPVPPTPKKTISTPTRRIRKYASAHDLEKTHQKEYQELHANRHIPLPNSPIHHSRKQAQFKNNNHDDDDDDIPLADAMRRLPPGPPSPALPQSPSHSRHHRHHRQNITSPTRPLFHYQQQQPYYHPNSSLLNDDQEDDDEDLVPIARLKIADHHPQRDESSFLKSAADKYKEKVKERLLMDDHPPSSSFSNPLYK